MENYIVRVYRRDPENADRLTGILESVEKETRQTFHSLNTLHSFLRNSPAEQPPEKGSPGEKAVTNPRTMGLSD